MMKHCTLILACVGGLGAVCGLSLAGECEPDWETVIGQPGVSSTVFAMALYDEGDGPRLFAGGFFSDAGGQPVGRIARWDGSNWSKVGDGLGFGGDVFAMTVWDDGTGEALYAGGHFLEADGNPVNRIAKWDGSNWSPLGEGVGGQIIDMAVYNDALYVVGDFQTAGGQPATFIARWDGSSWSSVGGGLNNIATSATVHDDGDGPVLIVSGVFTEAGGEPALRIAAWDGSSWSEFGGGAGGFVAVVRSLDLGSEGGSVLFAGGGYTTIGSPSVSAARIARWDGSAWHALGTGVNNFVRDLAAFDDGTGGGPALYAGGQFTIAGGLSANRIARWDGTAWSRLGLGVDGTTSPAVQAMKVACGITAPECGLYVGGAFTFADGENASRIATWRGCLTDDPTPKCPADLTGSGSVGVPDLLQLLACWGPIKPGCESADLTNDDVVGVPDLLDLLSQWGPCPR